MKASASGQRWAYRARPGEETATAQDQRGGGDTRPITGDGLQLRNPHTTDGVQTGLPHSPISGEALRAGVIDLLEGAVTAPRAPEVNPLFQKNRLK